MSILRRRVYKKKANTIPESYGYFGVLYGLSMSNEVISNGEPQECAKFPSYIYTKAYQKEDPVGTFPLANRLETSGTNPKTFTSGYTDGTEIVYATARHLYISSNNGTTWSTCDGNQYPTISTYWYGRFHPIVWFDSSYWYLLYAVNTTENFTEGDTSYYIWKRNKSTGTVDTTYLGTWTGDYKIDNMYGFSSNIAVSNTGQIMAKFKNVDLFIIFDISTQKYNYTDSTAALNTSGIPYNGGVGQWFYNKTTYGQWIISVLLPDRQTSNGSIVSDHCAYKTEGRAITYNTSSGSNYTWTEIAVPYNYVHGTNRASGIWIDADRIAGTGRVFAVCGSTTPNLFAYIGNINGTAISSGKDAGGGGITEAGLPGTIGTADGITKVYWKEANKPIKEIIDELDATGQMWPSAVMVSPDGKYGIALFVNIAIVFNLITGEYTSGFHLRDLEGYDDYLLRSMYFGYLYPRKVI